MMWKIIPTSHTNSRLKDEFVIKAQLRSNELELSQENLAKNNKLPNGKLTREDYYNKRRFTIKT